MDDRAVLDGTHQERAWRIAAKVSSAQALDASRRIGTRLCSCSDPIFMILAGAAAAIPLIAHAEEIAGKQSGDHKMAAPVIRISLGTVDAERASVVEAKLIEIKAALEPGIRGMRGPQEHLYVQRQPLGEH